MQETWVQSLGRNIPWRRERLPTPVFWPGEFHGLYTPWGCRVGHHWVIFFIHFSFFTQYIGLGIWSHHFKGNRWENWKQCQALVFWPPKSLQRDHSPKENSNVVNIVAWLDVGQTKTSRHQLHKDMKKKKRLRFHLGKTGLIKDVTKIGKLAELSLSPKSWSRFRY